MRSDAVADAGRRTAVVSVSVNAGAIASVT